MSKKDSTSLVSSGDYTSFLEKPGLKVLDVYTKWAGPCEPIAPLFKRFKVEFGDVLSFGQAQSDDIQELTIFRGKSRPTFLVFFNEILVKIVKGANAPLIEKTIREQLDIEKNGQEHVAESMEVDKSSGNIQEALAIVLPDGTIPSVLHDIYSSLKSLKFEIVNQQKVWLTQDFVAQHFSSWNASYLTAAPVLALTLSKENAVADLLEAVGPLADAKEAAPKSFRARFGTDKTFCLYAPENVEESQNLTEAINSLNVVPFDENDLDETLQKTLLVVQPEATQHIDAIIERLYLHNYTIHKREELEISKEVVGELLKGEEKTDEWVEYLTSQKSILLAVQGEDVVKGVAEMVGTLGENVPNLRVLYGTEGYKVGVFSSKTLEDAHQQLQLIFPSAMKKSASNLQLRPETPAPVIQTLALIKPDACRTGKTDEIIARIQQEGFTIVQQKEVHLSYAQAAEFYKEHQEKPFYQDLVNWMSSSPIQALVLERSNAISAWRELCGPTNSTKAKEIAPNSLRALYGTDGTQNAVHGSDSPDSVEREIKVIFEWKPIEEVQVVEEKIGGSKPALAEPAVSGSKSALPKSKPSSLNGSKAALSASKSGLSASKTGIDKPKSATASRVGSKVALDKTKSAAGSRVGSKAALNKSATASKASLKQVSKSKEVIAPNESSGSAQ